MLRRSLVPRRVAYVFYLILLIIVIGTVGFKLIGGSRTSWLDALFMTATTITTVGYGDVIGLDDKPIGKLFTIVYVLFSTGAILYVFTGLAAYIIEGELRKAFRQRSMHRRISKMKDHYVVCGIGMVGLYIVHELYQSKYHQIAVDNDEAKAEVLKAHKVNIDLVVGDATENEILELAMVKYAKGLFATTNSDNDNVVISLTAKQLNPELRVIARCNDTKNIDKIRRAGADAVVALNYIGGLRMASEMLRPHVVTLIDAMLRDRSSEVRVEELEVPKNSPYVGKSLEEADFRAMGNILIIALRKEHGEWIYNPMPSALLEKNMHMIFLATSEERDLLESLITGRPSP
ncbi:MAG TPA: potassium channel protein [Syntrophorhabdales bacterium]|nr:potassium channel protein [Syntrophorhabdales bacterium]